MSSYNGLNQLNMSKARIDLTEYIKEIVNQIDLDAEVSLLIDKDDLNRERINTTRDLFLTELNRFQNKVLSRLDDSYNSKHDENQKREDKFSECCFYLERDLLEKYRYKNESFGLLIFSDLHINQDDWNDFKTTVISNRYDLQFQHGNDDKKIKINSIGSKIHKSKSLLRSICFLREIKKAIQNDELIVYLTSNISYSEAIESTNIKLSELNNYLESLKNLKSIKAVDFDKRQIELLFRQNNFLNIENLDLSVKSAFDGAFSLPPHSSFYFANLKSLCLKNCQLHKIPSCLFQKLTSLEKLDLSSNMILNLDDKIFAGLERLDYLNLSNNRLTKLTPELFSSLTNLKHLSLYGNDFLTEMNHKLFECLIRLEILEMDLANLDSKFRKSNIKIVFPIIKNNLKKFILSAKTSRTSKVFNYDFNRLESFKSYIRLNIKCLPSKACSIKELSLYNLDIETPFCDLFANLSNLVELNIEFFTIDCKNENLDRFYDDMKCLKYLKIGFKQWNEFSIKFLLEIIFSDKGRLARLEISNIELEKFDKYTIKNKDLEEIFIKSSKLDCIESTGFNCLVNLKKLVMQFNNIESIDVNLFGKDISNLEVLDLYGNKIQFISKDHFKHLINLKILNLQSNNIQKLDAYLFSDMINLERLDLSSNKINQIDKNAFQNLRCLKYLSLRFNKIETLNGLDFESLSNLENINLGHNKIESIDDVLFSRLVQIKEIFLDMNQIREINLLDFVKLKSLDILDLCCNCIEEIDKKVYFYMVNTKNVTINIDKNPCDSIILSLESIN